MKVKVDVFRIAEKVPEQDEQVLVKERGVGSWKSQVFNKTYYCWDTEDGDDYDSDVDENDIWMRLPKDIDMEFANRIK